MTLKIEYGRGRLRHVADENLLNFIDNSIRLVIHHGVAIMVSMEKYIKYNLHKT